MSNGVTGGKFATLADLQASRPSVDTIVLLMERDNAEYIVRSAGTTPLFGDVVFANGNVGELQRKSGSWIATNFGAGIGGSASDDTTGIQGMADRLLWNDSVIFPKGSEYKLNATINFPATRKRVVAYGAKFTLQFDGVGFDLNPTADPLNIEAMAQSYGYWSGGEITSDIISPTQTTAFKVYAIRQMKIEDTIIGDSSATTIVNGIQIAALGGHFMMNNRFLNVLSCFHCPIWATGTPSAPITTSTFLKNEFILPTNGKAFNVVGGWNRWNIEGGFVNGSGSETFHFDNNEDARELNIRSVGFEQAVAGGKFIFIEDVGGNPVSPVNIVDSSFNGDPAGGGHIAIDLQNVIAAKITGSRLEGTAAASNKMIQLDANCDNVTIDDTNRFAGDNIVINCSRRNVVIGKPIESKPYINLSGFAGNSFSSGSATLNMKTLLGAEYPISPPLAYELLVQARDLGSAASTSSRVEFMQTITDPTTKRAMINLRGVPNDERVGQTLVVNADGNGDIAYEVFASGASTTDIWVYLVAIRN